MEPLLRDAIVSGAVVGVRSLSQAGNAIFAFQPTLLLVNQSFPRMDLLVLRAMAANEARIHSVASDVDLGTLVALVYPSRSRWGPPQL